MLPIFKPFKNYRFESLTLICMFFLSAIKQKCSKKVIGTWNKKMKSKGQTKEMKLNNLDNTHKFM